MTNKVDRKLDERDIPRLLKSIMEIDKSLAESRLLVEKLTKSPWVSVKERLPDEGVWCLIVFYNHGVSTSKSSLFGDGKFWVNCLVSDDCHDCVTHWMLIPDFKGDKK